MIRVGNAQAFWGDRPTAARELLAQVPELDFLTMDYLAEVSLSILAVQRERDARLGYARDFVDVISGLADYWASGGRCRLIANAGGLNPLACAEACMAALELAGCRPLKIGVVNGDDVLARLQADDGTCGLFANLDSQQPLSHVQSRLVTANAYLGCSGIVQALNTGADIVITGRVADPSMVAACCAHAFEWKLDDWDRLAGATVAGHLLECGTQVTGGISSDWLGIPDPTHLGFPIAEIVEDGSCTITKSECSGGHVTDRIVKEQLLYEIADPAQYLSPDVIVSFLGLQVRQVGKDRVEVRGAKGRPHPPTLKVSATYRDGYRASGALTIFGPQAVLKARRCGEMVLQRLDEAGHQYRDTIIECLGNAGSVPTENLTQYAEELFECVMRIAVESPSKSAVEQFSRELMPLVTSGPQGTTGYAEGRPRVHEVFRYWPCLIEVDRAKPHVENFITTNSLENRREPVNWPPAGLRYEQIPSPQAPPMRDKPLAEASCLADVAFGRSGDKGTSANVGILVRNPDDYAWLKTWLTPQRVAKFFEPLGVLAVERYEMPSVGGLNFVVRGILRRALRNDAQGKALAQALLSMPLDLPWLDRLTIGQALRETAARYPQQDAVVFCAADYRRSWSAFDQEVDRVARALLAVGLRHGDHFGVWATNIPQWVLLQFATARIGVVLVTINPSYRSNELAYALQHSNVRGLALIDHFKSNDYFSSLQQAVPELTQCRAGLLESPQFPKLKTVIALRGDTPAGTLSWQEFLSRADTISAEQLTQAETQPTCLEPINIQYTSGTTGSPKGAMLSHRNILLNAYYAGMGQQLGSQDRICIPVPLYHCFGCVLGTLCAVAHGATMVFPAESFHVGAVLEALEHERCTAVYGVPTMFIAMLENADFQQHRLRSLRTGIMAGSPCPIELMKRVTGELGAVQMTIGYGQTEASPLITQTQPSDSLELRVSTVGKTLPGIEAKVVDPETGCDLGDMQRGELCCRGHNVMLGYYNSPEQTAQAIDTQGWLHTGDLAQREPNGYYRITGRLRDVIIRGGENIFPREIEELLYEHPAVQDVQVIGVPDRKFGEQAMAWVQLHESKAASVEELKAFCQARLAHFKVPRYWKFVDTFPTTVTGKIQKYRMREISIEELGLQDAANIETA